MTAPDKRKNKVKSIQQQVAQGIHPMQDADVNVRTKAAMRAAEKMITMVLEKQK